MDLQAINEIQTLKARYFRFLDTCNLEGMQTVFEPDAEAYWKGGDYEIELRGWDKLRGFYEQAFTSTRFGMHTAHHPEIEVHGDSATGLWYLHDIFVNLEERVLIEGSALYEDVYQRGANGWRIRSTRYNRLLEMAQPVPADLRITCKPLDWKSAR